MSNKAVTWAYSLTTGSASAKAVLVVLADHADENFSCFPGVQTISAETELSPRTVKTQLEYLESLGLLSRSRRQNGFGGRKSDRYTLAFGLTMEQAAGRKDASDSAESTEGATAAPSVDVPKMGAVDNFDGPENAQGANFAPCANDEAPQPVDNFVSGVTQGATGAPQGANERRALIGLTPSFNPQKTNINQSSSRVTTQDAIVAMTDDDSQFFASPPQAGWLNIPRLSREGLLALLQQSPVVTVERLDLETAVRSVLARAKGGVHNPTHFVAKAIIASPDEFTKAEVYDSGQVCDGRWSWGQELSVTPRSVTGYDTPAGGKAECAAGRHNWLPPHISPWENTCSRSGECIPADDARIRAAFPDWGDYFRARQAGLVVGPVGNRTITQERQGES